MEAQWKLYEHYQFDFPVPAAPDENENTRHWLIAAANSGHPEAMFELSMKYRLGSENMRGVEIFEKDIEQADYWLDLAVAHKHPFALTYKSFSYFENGRPTEKAIALLMEAEALGDFDARVYLSRVRN